MDEDSDSDASFCTAPENGHLIGPEPLALGASSFNTGSFPSSKSSINDESTLSKGPPIAKLYESPKRDCLGLMCIPEFNSVVFIERK